MWEWPGTGDEPAAGEPSVESVVAFARERVTDDDVLFGHSMNSLLVLAVAAATRCRGVIAVAPPHPDPTRHADAAKAYWQAKATPERKARAAAIRTAFDTATDAEKPVLYAQYNSLRYFYDIDHAVPEPEAWEVPGDWAPRVLANMAERDWTATFDAVAAPVLLALGEYDFFAAPQSWLDESLRSGWSRELFTRSGHAPFIDEPDAFVAVVARWLATL